MLKTLKELKSDLKNGNISSLYVFYGEEGYLRDYYTDALIKQAVGDMMPEFNITIFSNPPEINALVDAVESYPAMSERRVVLVRDFDVFRADAAFSEKAAELFSDMPEHCVLIFSYGNIEYKPDKRRAIYKAFADNGVEVNFAKASRSDLAAWIIRRFAASEKRIDSETADYLMFYCGDIMRELIPEIEKISAYARHDEITRADIDAVATRNVTAVVFDVSNAVADGDFAKAISVLRELEERKENAIAVLALIARQFKIMYAAKLIRENGGGERELASLCGIKEYPARLSLQASGKLGKKYIKRAIMLCEEIDGRLKLGGGFSELNLLLATLAEEKKNGSNP